MRSDYADDPTLSNHLEESRSNLFDYFNKHYANASAAAPPSSPSAVVQPASMVAGSPQKCFTARYRRKEKASINELEEYFKLPAEDFDACHPIRWWFGRRAQFPNLFRMACDILCIPGKYPVSSVLQYFLIYVQVLQLPLKGSSRVVATQYPSGVLASVPTPFVHLCLSRSGYTLRASKLMLLSTVNSLGSSHPKCTTVTTM